MRLGCLDKTSNRILSGLKREIKYPDDIYSELYPVRPPTLSSRTNRVPQLFFLADLAPLILLVPSGQGPSRLCQLLKTQSSRGPTLLLQSSRHTWVSLIRRVCSNEGSSTRRLLFSPHSRSFSHISDMTRTTDKPRRNDARVFSTVEELQLRLR